MLLEPIYMVVSLQQYPGDDRGWVRNRGFDDSSHRLVRLLRYTTTAEEGVFTCDIPGDNNTPRHLGVYYPSESFSEGCSLCKPYSLWYE